jgi:hypothetical protein
MVARLISRMAAVRTFLPLLTCPVAAVTPAVARRKRPTRAWPHPAPLLASQIRSGSAGAQRETPICPLTVLQSRSSETGEKAETQPGDGAKTPQRRGVEVRLARTPIASAPVSPREPRDNNHPGDRVRRVLGRRRSCSHGAALIDRRVA